MGKSCFFSLSDSHFSREKLTAQVLILRVILMHWSEVDQTDGVGASKHPAIQIK